MNLSPRCLVAGALALAASSLCFPLRAADAPAPDLPSQVFAWDSMKPVPTPTGERRDAMNAPTSTLSKLACHISTLRPGERSSAPRLHPQEEFIIVKEGTIEATFDGRTALAPAGSIIFFAAGATTSMKNVGTVPATYYVLNYFAKTATP